MTAFRNQKEMRLPAALHAVRMMLIRRSKLSAGIGRDYEKV